MNAIELKWRKNGYDAGFIKDEYYCNLDECECAHFNKTVIGNIHFCKSFILKNPLGDIAVSGKTLHKLMKTNDELNSTLWRSYPDSKVDLWDQNVVRGEYVIAYEISPGLDPKIKSMLPEVSFWFRRRVIYWKCSPKIIWFFRKGRMLSDTDIIAWVWNT